MPKNGSGIGFASRIADMVGTNVSESGKKTNADATSEMGFRRMTMEEELAGLDKAFQSAADKAEVDAKASRLLDGYKERMSKLKSGQKLSADADKVKAVQENVSQKLVTLAQAWKDTYKVSGSKEGGMEKVLSMLNGMFGIKKEARRYGICR